MKQIQSLRKLIALSVIAAVFLCHPAAQALASTSYETMTKELRSYCAARPDVLHLYGIGSAAASGRPIWMVRISASGANADLSKTRRLLLICRQHGDEPVSTEAAIRFIHQAAAGNTPQLQREFGQATVYIIPMANPDGADKLQRLNGVGVDLNRDWGRFTQPETRAIYAAYKQIRPQMVVDMHSWTTTDQFQDNSVEACKAMTDADAPIATKALEVQRDIINVVRDSCGQRVSLLYYSQNDSLTLCHRFFAQQQGIVSLLVETAPSADSDAETEARITYDMLAIDTLVASLQDTGSWQQVAALERSEIAPSTMYTAPSESFSAEARAAPIAVPGAKQVLRVLRQVRLSKSALWWILGVYLCACFGMARSVAPIALRAWSRLLLRFGGEAHEIDVFRPYVSVRRRMYPESRFYGDGKRRELRPLENSLELAESDGVGTSRLSRAA